MREMNEISEIISIVLTKLKEGKSDSSSSSTTSSVTKSDFKTENGKLSFTDLEESLLNVTLSVAEVSEAAWVTGGRTSTIISS